VRLTQLYQATHSLNKTGARTRARPLPTRSTKISPDDRSGGNFLLLLKYGGDRITAVDDPEIATLHPRTQAAGAEGGQP
jgi:hypothetical protein